MYLKRYTLCCTSLVVTILLYSIILILDIVLLYSIILDSSMLGIYIYIYIYIYSDPGTFSYAILATRHKGLYSQK